MYSNIGHTHTHTHMMQEHHIQKPVRDSKGGLYVVVPLEFHWHYVIIISITYGDCI